MVWIKSSIPKKYWDRAIILIDMNAFFASVEQRDCPEWRGRPLAITNGNQGTCIITCSYEARRFGVKTGMRLAEAQQICPNLIQVPADPERYVATSRAIMQALTEITPDVEVFSVDEAFLDVSACQLLFGTPEKIARLAKDAVYDSSGLHCSLGLSGDKTTAKFAAKLQKPNGFTIIPPWQARQRLACVPVTELCGIKAGIGNFLAKHGVYVCGDMERLPISVLAQRFGNIGRRIWYMCQGQDPDLVKPQVPQPKSMGHGKVMPPNTCDTDIIETYLMHMCEKLGERLRLHHFYAQHFFIGLLNHDLGWIGGTGKALRATQDGREIFQLGLFVLYERWQGEPVSQIQVTALDPSCVGLQLDFITPENDKRRRINQALDHINHRFGEFTIAPAPLLLRSSMPNVIAPAWKPYGHRQTI